jgi:hypothetical protein
MSLSNFGFSIAVLVGFLAYDLFNARHLPREEWNATMRKSVTSKLALAAIVTAGFAAYAVVLGIA